MKEQMTKIERWPVRLALLAAGCLLFAAGCGDASIENTADNDDIQVEHTDPGDQVQPPENVWIPDRWLWGADTDAVFVPYGVRVDEDIDSVDFGEVASDQIYLVKVDDKTAYFGLPESHAADLMRQKPEPGDILAGYVDGTSVAFFIREVDASGTGIVFNVAPFEWWKVLRGDWDARVPLDLNDPEMVAEGRGGYILRRTEDGGVIRQEIRRTKNFNTYERTYNFFSGSLETSYGSLNGKIEYDGSLELRNELNGTFEFNGRIVDHDGWGDDEYTIDGNDDVWFDSVGSCREQDSRFYEGTTGKEVCVHQFLFQVSTDGHAQFNSRLKAMLELEEQSGETDPIISTESSRFPDLPEIAIPANPPLSAITIAPALELSFGGTFSASASTEVTYEPKLEWSFPLGFEFVDHYGASCYTAPVGLNPIPNDCRKPTVTLDPGSFNITNNATVDASAYAKAAVSVGVDLAGIDIIRVKGFAFGAKMGLKGNWNPFARQQGEEDCASIVPYITPFGAIDLVFEFDGVLARVFDDRSVYNKEVDFKEFTFDSFKKTDNGALCFTGPEYHWLKIRNRSGQTLHIDAVELSSNSETPASQSFASQASGATGSSKATGEPDSNRGNCNVWDQYAAKLSSRGTLWVKFDKKLTPGDSFKIIGSEFGFDPQSFNQCGLTNPNDLQALEVSVCQTQGGTCGDPKAASLGQMGYGSSDTITIGSL